MFGFKLYIENILKYCFQGLEPIVKKFHLTYDVGGWQLNYITYNLREITGKKYGMFVEYFNRMVAVECIYIQLDYAQHKLCFTTIKMKCSNDIITNNVQCK